MLPLSVGQQRHDCHAHTLTTFIFQHWLSLQSQKIKTRLFVVARCSCVLPLYTLTRCATEGGEGNAGRRCCAEAGRRRACGTCLRRPQTPFTAACTHAPSIHVPHSCRAAARTPKTPAWNAEPRLEGLSSGGTRRYVACPMRYRRGPRHAFSLRAQCPMLCLPMPELSVVFAGAGKLVHGVEPFRQ